jgi:large subunit ribosomal protein L21
MYAVIRTGGQQTTVQEGETIEVNRLVGDEGSEIVFDDVLIVRDESGTKIGTPRVPKAKVIGEIVAHTRGPKIRIYKFKRRKGFSRTQGHRQELTRVRIKTITR